MFNDLKDIEIAGGCYQKGTILKDVLARPINIIYGKNGSGKSSLAKAFYEYINDGVDRSFELNLGKELTEEEKNRIKVFDEDYVNRNVLVEGDELESIVMLGDQIYTAEKVKNLTQQSDIVMQRIAELEPQKDEAEKSKQTLDADVEKQLKADGKCKDRLMRAKGMRRRPTVTLQMVYDKRLNLEQYNEDPIELTNEVEADIVRLQNGMGGTSIVWFKHRTVGNTEIETVKSLLGKKLHKPELSDEDQDLMRIATEQFHYIEDARSELIAKGAKRCPLCQQPLTSDYLKELEERIKKVLNKDAENLKVALAGMKNKIYDLADDAPVFPNDSHNRTHLYSHTSYLS